MKKLVKWLLWLVFGIVLLGVAGMAAVLTLVDPNEYKPFIINTVKEATGRDMLIPGEIGLSFSLLPPGVVLELGELTLNNAEGFGEQPFAGVKSAAVGVNLWALLDKQVEADTLALEGLHLNLIKRKDGQTNWDDLAGGAAESDAKAADNVATRGAPLAGFAIGGVEISDARLSWLDESADQHLMIDGLNLNTGAVLPGKAVDLNLAFHVENKAPALEANIELAASPLFDLQTQRLSIEKLALAWDAKGEMFQGKSTKGQLETGVALDLAKQQLALAGLELNLSDLSPAEGVEITRLKLTASPQVDLAKLHVRIPDLILALDAQGEALQGKPLNAQLQASVDLDLSQETLKLDGLQLSSGDLMLKGQFQGQQVVTAPALAGQMKLSEFNLREWLGARGMALPEMADDKALTWVGLDLKLDATQDKADINALALRLDDTQLSGDLKVKNFAAPAISFQLALDSIDLDRYLPPPPPEEAGQAGSAKPAAAAVAGEAEVALLPVETLRQLNLNGTFQVGKVKVKGLNAADIKLSVQAKDGKLSLGKQIGRFYEGSLQGRTEIDARGKQPVLKLEEALSQVQAGPLLKDLTGKEQLLGKGQFQMKLNTSGNTEGDMRKNLGGNLSFRFEDGAVKGINVAQLIRVNWAKVQGQPVAESEEPQQTDFSELSGSAQIDRGLLTNKDLRAKSPLLRIDGKGRADLVKEQLNYTLTATLVGSLEGQGGIELKDLQGVPVPVRLAGPFADLKPSVDMEELGKRLVKTKVGQEAEQKIQEKLKDKLPEQFQNQLKGLFQ